MKNDPLVSVIIPTYNRADRISAAIKSVLNQIYKNIQLIVIDDGSFDNTHEVIKQFPSIEYFVQEHSGQAAARNKGLQQAKGPLIASLDSDDNWHPDFLMQCVTKLEQDKLDFVFANWLQQSRDVIRRDFLGTYPALIPFIKNAQNNWVSLNRAELKYLYLRGCPSPSSSVLIRKSSILSGWNPKINIGDDWCLLLDMILNKKECKAAFCLQQLWTKYVHDSNIYDGHAWNEVTELLYVKDLKNFVIRYRHLLDHDEIKELAILHQKGLLNLAVYQLFKKKSISTSFQLVKRSFAMGAGQTIKLFPNTLRTCLDLKMKSLNTPPANITLSTTE